MNHVQRTGIASTMSNEKKPVLRSSSYSGASNSITRSQPANVGTSKSVQQVPDGYDPKLVEMINTAIVDQSPSVKWDDIGSASFLLNFSFNLFYFITFSFVLIFPKLDTDWSGSIVAGLQKAKQALLEMVILPTKRRDLFTGLRKPARGSAFRNCQHIQD